MLWQLPPCVVSAFVIVLLVSHVNCQDRLDSPAIMGNIDKAVKSLMSANNIRGLSLAIVRENEVVAKGYGHVKLHENDFVTNKTLFCIGSLTKGFTAALLLKLIEKHPTFSLTTKVRNILKQNIFGDELRNMDANLVDLLSHRMGYTSLNKVRADENLTRSSIVERIKHLKPDANFRTSFYYNNFMFELLVHITEKLGKSRWEDLMTQNIFRPIGMTSSTFFGDVDSKFVAESYLKRHQEKSIDFDFYRKWSRLGGSSNIVSNAEDMAKWIQFQLKSGRNENNTKVLSERMMDAMRKSHNILRSLTMTTFTIPTFPVAFVQVTYGLAWRIGFYRGYSILCHSGTIPGFISYIFLIPERKVGIYISATGYDFAATSRIALGLYIADLLLGERPWLNESTISTFPHPWYPSLPENSQLRQDDERKYDEELLNKASKTAFARPITDYEGVYNNNLYGNIVLSLNSSDGLLHMRHGIAEYVIYPNPNLKDRVIAEARGLITSLQMYIDIYFNFYVDPISFVIPKYSTAKNDVSTFIRQPTRRVGYKDDL